MTVGPEATTSDAPATPDPTSAMLARMLKDELCQAVSDAGATEGGTSSTLSESGAAAGRMVALPARSVATSEKRRVTAVPASATSAAGTWNVATPEAMVPG